MVRVLGCGREGVGMVCDLGCRGVGIVRDLGFGRHCGRWWKGMDESDSVL